MLAVIAIIGILVTIIVPNAVGVITRAEDEAKKVQISSVKNAILNYYLDEGEAMPLEEFLAENVFADEHNLKGNLDLGPYLDGFYDEEGSGADRLDQILEEEDVRRIYDSFNR